MINKSSLALFYNGTITQTPVTLLTLPSTATGVPLTVAQLQTICRMTISCDTGALRIQWDMPTGNAVGTTYTQIVVATTNGLIIPAANWPHFELTGNANIRNLQLVRSGTTNCVVNIMFENQ